tara:strand:+ start:1126 stop:1587 length:462 start_codon:yes stop_codon:yes gene_type:complete
MAYGPGENETEEESEARFVRERARKDRREQKRALRKQEKNQLKQTRGSKARRELRDEFDKVEKGIESGGIYDVDTNTYTPPEGNVAGSNTNMTETGVQSIPRDSLEDVDSIDFNGSVLLCINGAPFYIDIPYDPTTGVYSESNGANYPITAPE